MSLRAMVWALEAQLDDPLAKLVLLVLADQADSEGRGAWPSQHTIATTVPCSRATVQRKLPELEAAGWIVRGEQQLVAHLRSDRRPVVWNLPITGPHSEAPSGPRGLSSPPNGASHGASHVRHDPRETQETTRRAAQPRDDGAPRGCAAHGARRPGCAECQRARAVEPERIRPVAPATLAAARALALAPQEEAHSA